MDCPAAEHRKKGMRISRSDLFACVALSLHSSRFGSAEAVMK
jgi:hypothetical protein